MFLQPNIINLKINNRSLWGSYMSLQTVYTPISCLSKYSKWYPGLPRKHFMEKPRACDLWKWTCRDFFQTSPKKISLYQGFTSKQIQVGWIHYHLRTVICNPRRNFELIVGRIKCKQSTSFWSPDTDKPIKNCITSLDFSYPMKTGLPKNSCGKSKET